MFLIGFYINRTENWLKSESIIDREIKTRVMSVVLPIFEIYACAEKSIGSLLKFTFTVIVLPIASVMGLYEWIANKKSLKDLLQVIIKVSEIKNLMIEIYKTSLVFTNIFIAPVMNLFNPSACVRWHVENGLCQKTTEGVKKETKENENLKGFAGIAGMNNLKDYLNNRIIKPYKDPVAYQSYALKVPHGCLLFGPPGCGKTLIAKKLSEEMGCKLFTIKAAEIGSKYLYETEQNIKKVFDEAAKSIPASIFIDEIECMISNRSEDHLHEAYKKQIGQFLEELHHAAERGVFVIGATNHPEKLDTAIIRPGRFDLKIYIGVADEEGRAAQIKYNLESALSFNEKWMEDRQIHQINYSAIAKKIGTFSASDIDNLVQTVAQKAFAKQSPFTTQLFLESISECTGSVTPQIEANYKKWLYYTPLPVVATVSNLD